MLLGSCTAARKWRLATNMFDQRSRSGTKLDVVSLNTYVRARHGNWVAALSIYTLASWQRLEVDERTGGILLTSFRQSSLWKTSEEMFRSIFTESLRVNAICQSALMTSHLSHRKWLGALVVWTKMIRLGILQDQTSRNIALNAWCQCRWVQAETLLRRNGDSTSFNTVASSPFFSWRQSQSLLQRMIQNHQLRIDTVGATAYLWSQARMAKWQEARILFKEFAQQRIRYGMAAYTACMESSCNWTRTFALLERTLRSKLEIDQVFANAFISAAKGGWQKGLQMLRFQPHLLFSREMSTSLLHKFAWPRVLHTVQSLPADTFCINAALDACNARWQLCISLLRCMVALQLRRDDVTYTETMSSMSSTSSQTEWNSALATLEAAKCEGIDLNEFMVSAAQTACGKGMAWTVPLKLLSDLTVNPLIALNEVVYTAATSVLGKCSKWTTALVKMSEMHRARIECTDFYFDASFGAGAGWRTMLEFTIDVWGAQYGYHEMHDGAIFREGQLAGTSVVSTSCAMAQMWEQTLHLLRINFWSPESSGPMVSDTCFTSLAVACEHVKNEYLLAELLALIPDSPVNRLRPLRLKVRGRPVCPNSCHALVNRHRLCAFVGVATRCAVECRGRGDQSKNRKESHMRHIPQWASDDNIYIYIYCILYILCGPAWTIKIWAHHGSPNGTLRCFFVSSTFFRLKLRCRTLSDQIVAPWLKSLWG